MYCIQTCKTLAGLARERAGMTPTTTIKNKPDIAMISVLFAINVVKTLNLKVDVEAKYSAWSIITNTKYGS